MNKIIKKAVILAVAAAAALSAGIVAYADSWEKTNVDVDYDSSIVTVSGTLPIQTEADIAVMVLNPNCSTEDMTNKSYKEVINYSDQITSAPDGSFSFSYKHSGDDGFYKIIMSVKAYNLTDNEHGFLATSRRNEIISEINTAKNEGSVEKMQAALANAMSLMTLNCDDYDKFIAGGGSNEEICKNLAEDARIDSIAGLKDQITKAIMLTRLNGASAEELEGLIDYYAEYIGINDSSAYVTYKEKSKPEAKQMIANVFAAKNFDVNTDIKSFFSETVITQAVNEAARRFSHGEIKTILTDNAAAVGIDISAAESLEYPDNVYKALLSSSYTTLEALGNAFNSAVSAQRAAETGGSGAGGSSGGGGGGGGGTVSKGSSSMPSIGSSPSSVSVTNTTAAVFSDMTGYEWAQTAVSSLYKRGAVNGRDENRFDPAGNVTREEFAKMLSLAIGVNADKNAEEFSDVRKGEWYYEPVMTLASKEIVNGIGDGLFGVGTNISREDMAVMIYRAMQYMGADVNTAAKSEFTDYKAVSDYARSAVSYLESVGVINGMDDGTFAPKEKVTRAQAAVIIYNMLVFCGI